MGNCSGVNVNPCRGKDSINVRPHGNASESSETDSANAQTSNGAASSTPESTSNRKGSVWKRMKKRARRKKRTKKCVEVAHDQQEAAAAESEVELPGCSKISSSAVTLTGSDHQADKLFLGIPEINIIPCSPSGSLTSLLSSSQISCHAEHNELPVCIPTPLQVPHRGSEILDTLDCRIPENIESELPVHNEDALELSSHVEEEAQLSVNVEEETQMSSHVEEEEQLSAHVKEEAQMTAHVEEQAQMPSHVEEEVQLSAHVEEEPQGQSCNANTTPQESPKFQSPACSSAQTESPASCSYGNITPSAHTEAELSAPFSVDENQSPANYAQTESLQLPDFLGAEAELSAIFSSNEKVRYMSDWLKDVSDLHTVYSDDEGEETSPPSPAQSSGHKAHSSYPDDDKKTWYSGVAAVSTTISEGLRSMFGFVSRIIHMPTVTTGILYVKETRSILKPAGATGTSAQGKKAVHWEPGITSQSDAADYNRVERLLASKRRVKVEKCKILLNDRQHMQRMFADKDMDDSDDETQVRPHTYTGTRQQAQTSTAVRHQPPRKYDKTSIQNMFGGCDDRNGQRPQTSTGARQQAPKKYDKKSIQNLFAGCDTEDSNDNSRERAYTPTGTRGRSHRPRATPSNSRTVLSSASNRGSGRIQLYFPAIDPRPQ